MNHQMQNLKGQLGGARRRQVKPGVTALCILLVFAMIATGCAKSRNTEPAVSPAARDASLRQIAADYSRTGDLAQAQAALDKLGLANPTQLLVSQAESDVSAGLPASEIEPAARLAEALGARSAKLIAYLEPTPTAVPPTVTSSPVPPSPTAAPSATPTTEPPTATPEQPTITPTPEPQQPRAIADSDVNLRGGPGRAYPTVGKLLAGQEVEILGRNVSGDWWQLAWPGGKQAWVAGTVVQILGPIDTVAVAKNIPAPPVQPTRAPQPTAAPTTPPKPAGPDFRLTEHRLWTNEENGGRMDGPSVHCGQGQLFRVTVLDAAGNRLNGVAVKVVGGEQQEVVTGSQGKGDGIAEFDLYEPGADVQVIRDVDGHQTTSDTATGPTMTDAIPFDVLMGAHYCSSTEDCSHFLSQNGCSGHYSWSATYRRAY
jgi:uncharacterized protein YraI